MTRANIQVRRIYDEPSAADGTRVLVDRRYRDELADAEHAPALDHLHALAKHHTLTLLTAAREADLSEAAVLAEVLRGKPASSARSAPQ